MNDHVASPSAPSPAPARTALTDSPWFWLLIFANAALIGLMLIAPKYGRRQAGLERRYQIRGEVARRKASGELPANFSAEDAPELPISQPQIVTLGPLLSLLAIVNLVALVLFYRHHARPPETAAPTTLSPPSHEVSP